MACMVGSSLPDRNSKKETVTDYISVVTAVGQPPTANRTPSAVTANPSKKAFSLEYRREAVARFPGCRKKLQSSAHLWTRHALALSAHAQPGCCLCVSGTSCPAQPASCARLYRKQLPVCMCTASFEAQVRARGKRCASTWTIAIISFAAGQTVLKISHAALGSARCNPSSSGLQVHSWLLGSRAESARFGAGVLARCNGAHGCSLLL